VDEIRAPAAREVNPRHLHDRAVEAVPQAAHEVLLETSDGRGLPNARELADGNETHVHD
jgi:hypothetical protein